LSETYDRVNHISTSKHRSCVLRGSYFCQFPMPCLGQVVNHIPIYCWNAV